MNNVEDLVRELNNMPRGYISKKKIKGKEYNYLQYLDGDKLKSTYVRESELDYYVTGIARRKEIENELKLLGEVGKNAPKISERARSLTGCLMSGDVEVARTESGELVYINEKMAPLILLRTRSVAGFLASRALDSSRTNSRLLKKVMDIHGEPDEIVSLYAHGATITDNFWFKAKGSKLKYEDIRFDSDAYSEIALDGKIIIYNKTSKLSPQLTLGGSYEKCWKLIGGEWWLYKKGNEQELFSELISSRIAEQLGLPTAAYEILEGYIRSRNFASSLNFEPMTSIAGEDDRMETVYSTLLSLNEQLAKDYLRLIIFDAIVKNEDRHNENCGIMRDPENGKIVGVAPNFDNNISLVSRSEILNMDCAKDGLINHLLKFIRGNERARSDCRGIVIKEISEADVLALAKDVDICEKVDREQLAKFIAERFRYLKRMLEFGVKDY